MKLAILLAAVIILFFSSCCSSNKLLNNSELKNTFGSNYIYRWNDDKTFLLAVSKNSFKNSASSYFEYFIYNADADSVILKETYSGGNAEWIDSYKIKVETIPGNISGDEKEEDFEFVFDVKLNKKLK